MKETKNKSFIDVIQILPCLSSSWRMDWRIYRGGRTRILLSSPTMIDPHAQAPGLTEFKLIQKLQISPKLTMESYPFLITTMLYLLTHSLLKPESGKIWGI